MTIIIVVLTIAVIITLELIGKSRLKSRSTQSGWVTEDRARNEIIERYIHPGHMWALVADRRQISVGIDDFSERIIGTVDSVDLPEVGRSVQQGEPLTQLHHENRVLVHIAPISGTVVDVNRKLILNPDLVNNSPFEWGWIAKIVPTNLETDLRNLLKGIVADGWREAVRAQLIQMFSQSVGVVLQDGGQYVEDLGEHFSDDQWNHVVQEFYPTVPPKHNQKTQ